MEQARRVSDIATHRAARRMSRGFVGSSLMVVVTLVLFGALPTSAADARLVSSGSRHSGAVALTFDDGWNRSACARIGRTLRAHHATGTFFINGKHIRREPVKWRCILRKQQIGNHTRSHHDLTAQSTEVVRRQIRGNEAIHKRYLDRSMLKVFRPPYGAQNHRVRQIAAASGYRRTVLWNIDTRDWSSAATVSSVVSRAIGARPGSIILMHCARSVTPRALPAIIRHYQARGIKLVGLRRLLGL